MSEEQRAANQSFLWKEAQHALSFWGAHFVVHCRNGTPIILTVTAIVVSRLGAVGLVSQKSRDDAREATRAAQRGESWTAL